MRVLVTGGCGFIGSNFVRHVVHEYSNVSITVLDALTYAANAANLAGLDRGRVEVVVGDICDAPLVDKLVARSDAVVNFAAETHNDNSIVDPAPFLRTNIQGVAVLLQACTAHGVRFHQVSTDEVFGDMPLGSSDRFTEESPYRPSSPYSASKAAADMLVRAWVRTYGTKATISCSSNNYGPYQHVEKFIPRQVTNLIEGRPPKLYGTGANVRDWIHVDDHSHALCTILEKGRIGETYLVSAGCERSNLQVMQRIVLAFGRTIDCVEHVADRPGHDLRYALDASKLRVLGWTPQHADFERGLDQTIAWYRAHAGVWTDVKEETERRYARRERPSDGSSLPVSRV
ncbi:MAG: dTDP-glucose 4,6-dehydratase [Coriobacteriaceae bacterium]|nr:dTDP-glucose 4,6-dehydratase [Coriobacteriaceae bacterium]